MKLALIDDWRTHLKHARSLRLMAVGLFFQVLSFLDHSGLLGIWNMMPPGMQQIMPGWANQAIGAILFCAAMLAMLIGQPKLQARLAENCDG